MKKIAFAPLGILAGLLAGFLAQKLFERIWALIDDEDPPRADRRDAPLAKLAAALVLEGAIFRLAKGMADREVRRGFAKATGRWPGVEAEPEPAENE